MNKANDNNKKEKVVRSLAYRECPNRAWDVRFMYFYMELADTELVRRFCNGSPPDSDIQNDVPINVGRD